MGTALPQPGPLRRNIRHGALVLDLLTNGVGVIGTIGHDQAAGRQVPQQGFGSSAVSCLARCQHEGEWTSKTVRQGVELAGAAAAADAERLSLLPPLPPVAQRWAFT